MSSLMNALGPHPNEPAMKLILTSDAHLEHDKETYELLHGRWLSTSEPFKELKHPLPYGTVMHPSSSTAKYVLQPEGWVLQSLDRRPIKNVPIEVIPYIPVNVRTKPPVEQELWYNVPLFPLNDQDRDPYGNHPAFVGDLVGKMDHIDIRFQVEELVAQRRRDNESLPNVHLLKDHRPIKRQELVDAIASHLKPTLDTIEKVIWVTSASGDTMIEVTKKNLVLISVKRVSLGCLQPILGVRVE